MSGGGGCGGVGERKRCGRDEGREERRLRKRERETKQREFFKKNFCNSKKKNKKKITSSPYFWISSRHLFTLARILSLAGTFGSTGLNFSPVIRSKRLTYLLLSSARSSRGASGRTLSL